MIQLDGWIADLSSICKQPVQVNLRVTNYKLFYKEKILFFNVFLPRKRKSKSENNFYTLPFTLMTPQLFFKFPHKLQEFWAIEKVLSKSNQSITNWINTNEKSSTIINKIPTLMTNSSAMNQEPNQPTIDCVRIKQLNSWLSLAFHLVDKYTIILSCVALYPLTTSWP